MPRRKTESHRLSYSAFSPPPSSSPSSKGINGGDTRHCKKKEEEEKRKGREMSSRDVELDFPPLFSFCFFLVPAEERAHNNKVKERERERESNCFSSSSWFAALSLLLLFLLLSLLFLQRRKVADKRVQLQQFKFFFLQANFCCSLN